MSDRSVAARRAASQRRRRRGHLLLCAAATAATCGIAAHRASGDIDGFSSGLTLNGGASVTGAGDLQLTDTSSEFQARSAFVGTAQSIGTFNAQFTYNLSGT